MPQLCLYVDDATLEGLRRDARAANKSLSRFVVDELNARGGVGRWPEDWFSLYGAMRDDGGFAEPEDEPFSCDEIPSLDGERSCTS